MTKTIKSQRKRFKRGAVVNSCPRALKPFVTPLVWSRTFAFGLGVAPLVWPLVGTRVEYLLNVGHICGYSGISEITSNSCDDPPRTKRKLEDLVVRFVSEATRKR